MHPMYFNKSLKGDIGRHTTSCRFSVQSIVRASSKGRKGPLDS